LIIDEVLAVGDIGFILKCFKTIDSILPHTAIVFVSHSMPQISRLCSQIILMDRGMVASKGSDISKAIDLFYSRFSDNDSKVIFNDGSITLEKVELLNNQENSKGVPQLQWNSNLKIYFKFRMNRKL